MMKSLILAEVSVDELISDSTASVVVAASGLGQVILLVCGSKVAAEQAAKISGVDLVMHIDDRMYRNDLAETIVTLLHAVASDFTHILAPATSFSKNILPRLATALDVMVISDVTEIIDAKRSNDPFMLAMWFKPCVQMTI